MHWLTKTKIKKEKMKKLLDSFVNIFLVVFSIALVGGNDCLASNFIRYLYRNN